MNDEQHLEGQETLYCRRQFGRRRQEWLDSDLGPVTDLSPGGLRVLTRRKYSGERRFNLITANGLLEVVGRVTHCRRLGIGRFEIGLEFLELDEQTMAQIQQTAIAHANTRLAG